MRYILTDCPAVRALDLNPGDIVTIALSVVYIVGYFMWP